MFAKERQFEPNQASYVARSTLVILPPSILHQWEKELQAWAPFLDVFVFQGSDVHKNTDIALARLMTCDVVLISCTAALVSFISKLLLDVFCSSTLQLFLKHLQGIPSTKSIIALGTTKS